MPSADNDSLEHHARRVLILQAALAVLLALLVLAYGQIAGNVAQASKFALAGLFGALLGMLGTVISRRSVSRSGQAAGESWFSPPWDASALPCSAIGPGIASIPTAVRTVGWRSAEEFSGAWMTWWWYAG